MSTVDKNPVVKTRSGEVRGSEASGVVDEFEMKARVNEILNRRPTVGLAVGVVRNGSLEFFSGHGLAATKLGVQSASRDSRKPGLEVKHHRPPS